MRREEKRGTSLQQQQQQELDAQKEKRKLISKLKLVFLQHYRHEWWRGRALSADIFASGNNNNKRARIKNKGGGREVPARVRKKAEEAS